MSVLVQWEAEQLAERTEAHRLACFCHACNYLDWQLMARSGIRTADAVALSTYGKNALCHGNIGAMIGHR